LLPQVLIQLSSTALTAVSRLEAITQAKARKHHLKAIQRIDRARDGSAARTSAAAHTNVAIARELNISKKTVDTNCCAERA
jgi:DNA-binding NarL/FixJ family response regulator